MRDYYSVLRVARNASQNEIKAAYRLIALAVHPDVNKGCKDMSEEFKAASEAYSVLGNSEQRRDYDKILGVESVRVSQERWSRDGGPGVSPKSSKFSNGRPVYGSAPPPDMDTKGEGEWKAWHYEVNPLQKPRVKQSSSWMYLHGNSDQQFFHRQVAKENALWGVGRGYRYSTSIERERLTQRVKLRRERRLKQAREREAEAARAREGGGVAAEESGCSIS
ncbi:unnamed protein product [Choristocarpus tenellus]